MSDCEITPEQFTEFTKNVTKEVLRAYRETEINALAHEEDLEQRKELRRMIELLTQEIERRERNGEA
jgi:hypothetical protein